VTDPHKTVSAIEQAIVSTSPQLRQVSEPYLGFLTKSGLSPSLYPDSSAKRGFYVPVPPPPGFKVSPRHLPVLVGVSGGRQWTVEVMAYDGQEARFEPALRIQTYVRFQATDVPPFPVLPWFVAACQPTAGTGPGALRRGPFNVMSLVGPAAVGQAAVLIGRSPVPLIRPPVLTPLVLEAWDPRARAYLESAEFLELFARWESRAGVGSARGGSALPVLKMLGDELTFSTGIDTTLDPTAHANTVQELLSVVPRFEKAITGRDPESDPIPTITFTDPPGSVPDIRPAYRCPNCGKLEILKIHFDRGTGMAQEQTLGCHSNVFPAYLGRYRDVMSAGAEVVQH
jgi:hypothetical protein